MSMPFEVLVNEQAFDGGAKLSWTAMWLRQFEALHQYWPSTAGEPDRPCWNCDPGAKVPVDSQLDLAWSTCWVEPGSSNPPAICSASAAAGSSLPCDRDPLASQLMPSIGMATNEQATVCEQPSEAWSSPVKT